LALGPLTHLLAARAGWALQALDGFVLVSVGGLVLADVIPHALQHGGWLALPTVVVGLVGPTVLERTLHKAAEKVHTAALVLGLFGLMLHATVDGLALGSAGGGHVHVTLATAVLLHRLPEGLTIWWLLRPAYGARMAVLALALVALATGAGVGLAGRGLQALADGSLTLAAVEALVGGSLLHVVLHRPHPLLKLPRKWHWASGTGALAGAALLALMLAQGADHHMRATAAHPEVLPWWDGVFWTLARQSAPALLIAYAAAGMVQVALPGWSLQWMARGGRLQQALRGTVFGLPLPICSCGVVPIWRSLALQGVPPAASYAFLVATPELGMDAVLLSLPLLGAEMAVARVVAAALVAISVGWLMARLLPSVQMATDAAATVADHGVNSALTAKAPPGFWPRLVLGLRVGFGEIVDHTGPWVLLGLCVAAVAAPILDQAPVAGLPPLLGVPLLALLGMPMYVCASGATPLVAVLIGSGVSPGAGLAFLLTGPATNVSTFGVLARLHGERAALALGATMAALAVLAGWAVDAVLLGYTVPVALAGDHDHAGPGAHVAVGALALLLLLSLMRQGPRGFVSQILAFAVSRKTREAGGHAHGHHHGHDHDHAHHDDDDEAEAFSR
jgi:uncharacterized membrane protein YraQ (UPF0718 family)